MTDGVRDPEVCRIQVIFAFQLRETAMAQPGSAGSLQKFASIHASVHNDFNHECHLNRHDVFKQGCSAAMAEWRRLAAQ